MPSDAEDEGAKFIVLPNQHIQTTIGFAQSALSQAASLRSWTRDDLDRDGAKFVVGITVFT